ncbi:MAG TPA: response regulator transcription factor [Opitutaceae bacterium]|nr:response regulator transcription factor [Opitutaceae bacterium]
MQIKVAIVEDNAGLCEELQHVLASAADLVCVCVCCNAEDALHAIPKISPDVIIMDIRLPDASGIECTSRLKRLLPEAQILMFTIQDDTEKIVKALEAGASGYLLKDTAPAEIIAAVRDVHNHGAPMSRDVARKLVATFHHPARDTGEPLTLRESEILGLLGEGLLYKEIGDRLTIKLDTVRTHVKNIYRKLHVRSRTQALMNKPRGAQGGPPAPLRQNREW